MSDGAQAIAESTVAAMLDRDAFSRWLGVELLSVAPHAATLRMRVREEMTNGFGVCHGGVTFSLADSALACASNTRGTVAMSIENAIGYPTAVHPGDVLVAVAAPDTPGRRIGFYRVTVTNQHGVAVAHFRGTVYDTGRPHAAPGFQPGLANPPDPTS